MVVSPLQQYTGRLCRPASPTPGRHGPIRGLALAVAVASLFPAYPSSALAASLNGADQSATVDGNTALENWGVSNGASLWVTDGGAIGSVIASYGAVLRMDHGATATTNFGSAVTLRGGSAVIQGATLETSANDGDGLTLTDGLPGVAATATVVNSSISGKRSAVYIERKHRAEISGSTLKGTDEGIHVDKGGQVTVSDTDIDGRLMGINVGSAAPDGTKSLATASRVHIKSTNWGIAARWRGEVDISDSTVDVLAPQGRGIVAAIGGTVQARDVDIVMRGTSAVGLDVTQDASVVNLQGGSIDAPGAGSKGANVSDNAVLSLDGTRMRINGTGVLTALNGATHLNNVELTTLGSGTGAEVKDGATLSIAASRVQASGQGIMVTGTTRGRVNAITITDSQLSAGGSAFMAVDANRAVITLTNSDVTSAAGSFFTTGGNSGSSVLNASHSRMQGSIQVAQGYVADFNLTDGSQWQGTGTGINHLSLASGSQWHMQSSSDVQSLNNSGTVAFAPGAFNTLTVRGDLTGSGLFEMNTDLAAGRSDLLTVGGSATGSHQILVHNAGGEPSAGNQHQEIVRTEGGDARFSLANRGQVVDAGTYRYRLQTSDTVGGRSTDWSLVHVGQVPTVVPLQPGQIVPVVLQPGDDLSTGANAAVNTGGIGSAQSIWYAEMNALVKRLGELRLGNDQGGPWARAYRQRQLINNQGGRGFRQNVGGTELGADSRISTSNGRWYLGAMAGYSRADRKFADEGNGGTDSYHVGGYATYIANSGWYVDTVAKVNHMKHDFKVEATDGAMIKGNYKNQGVGVSVEAGRQVGLANGWFIEPQAELAVFRANSARYRLNNGMRVAAEGGSSVLLRMGSLVGRRLEMSNGNTVQPYVKIGWSQEFDGKSVVRTNGIGTRTDVSGGRAELGAGVIAALGKDHRLYADYEYKKGSRFESPWAVNVGYRYTW